MYDDDCMTATVQYLYLNKLICIPYMNTTTHVLVPEVLCSLVGPETRNCILSCPILSSRLAIPVSETNFYPIIFIFKRL